MGDARSNGGIVDLHSHFPMHLDDVASRGSRVAMMQKGRPRWLDRLRALVLRLANRLENYRDWNAGPAVTVDSLVAGRVRVALSVLYQPFDEMDVEGGFHAAPEPTYFRDLVAQLELVEEVARADHRAVVARSPADLARAAAAGKLALVHAVEGGFHFGASVAQIDQNVAEAARRGVAYVTVAHLFWRGFATNAPALPFLADRVYRFLFPEPALGLSELGRALVDALARERILVDVTHMSARAIEDTLARLPKDAPVIASHMACRFGALGYNLTDAQIRAISERGGVMGVILCEHYANERQPKTKSFAESFAVIERQVEHIRKVTGSYDSLAIGTDLDGFIKPTLAGLDDARNLAELEEALVRRYGPVVGEQICSGNALRVLESYWRGREVAEARAAKAIDAA